VKSNRYIQHLNENKSRMEYRKLGKSGLKVSVFSLGSWVNFNKGKVDEDEAIQLLKYAYENGVRFFDGAEAYAAGEAERILGKAIAKLNWRRSDYVVSTKIFWGGSGVNENGLSFKHIVEGTNAALDRLQVAYVDIVFAHRPDILTPIEETVRAFTNVINQGKAFYWGTSEWSAEQIREAYHVAKEWNLIPPTVEQPQYHLFHRERVEVEYAPLYKLPIGLGTTIWSPLHYGILTGKYNDGVPEGTRLTGDFFKETRESLTSPEGQAKLQKVRELTELAKTLDASVAQLALAWCAKNDHVSTVILGATSLAQLEENLGALKVIPKLTPEILEKIENIVQTKPPAVKTFGR